jgi:hypothetical protein
MIVTTIITIAITRSRSTDLIDRSTPLFLASRAPEYVSSDRPLALDLGENLKRRIASHRITTGSNERKGDYYLRVQHQENEFRQDLKLMWRALPKHITQELDHLIAL